MDHNEELVRAFLDDLMTTSSVGQRYVLGFPNTAVTLRVESIERCSSGPLKIHGQEMVQRIMGTFFREGMNDGPPAKSRPRKRVSRDTDFKRFMSSIGMEDTNA